MILNYGCATLRAIEERDCYLLLELINSPNIDKWVGNVHLPISKESQEKWIRDYKNNEETIRLMIELSNGKTIGMIMLQNIDYKNSHAEIGIKIDVKNKANRMKNDVDDAYKALLTFAFQELNLNCIYAYVMDENEHSLNFHSRNNFSMDGKLKDALFTSGKYHDMLIFSMKRKDFFNWINN